MDAIVKRLRIEAPVSTVWQHLTDPDKQAGWFHPSDFEPVAGHSFQFTGAPSGRWDGTIQCRVVELAAPNRLVFTFDHNIIDGETLVTIELKEDGGATELTLTHTGFENTTGDRQAHRDDHDEGWGKHLAQLKPLAEGREVVGS